jgi:hypothetical protein
MANSLPGCPIVGYYREDKDDFADHGERVIIDSDGVKFEKLTRIFSIILLIVISLNFKGNQIKESFISY